MVIRLQRMQLVLCGWSHSWSQTNASDTGVTRVVCLHVLGTGRGEDRGTHDGSAGREKTGGLITAVVSRASAVSVCRLSPVGGGGCSWQSWSDMLLWKEHSGSTVRMLQRDQERGVTSWGRSQMVSQGGAEEQGRNGQDAQHR